MANVTEAGASGYSADMDGRAHEATYVRFTHFTTVGSVFVACIVAGLAVGGVRHAWISAIFCIVLAHVATAVGLFSPRISWRPGAAVLVLLLVMLALY